MTQVVTSGDPREVVAADFNRDGHVDIAVALYACGCVEVWLGHGDNTFDAASRRSSAASGSHGIAAADFNNDGIVDVVVTNALSANATVLFGNGTGSFPLKATVKTGAGPRYVTTGDFITTAGRTSSPPIGQAIASRMRAACEGFTARTP